MYDNTKNLKYPHWSMLLTLCPFMPGSPGVPGKPRAPCKGKGALMTAYSPIFNLISFISLYCVTGLFQRSEVFLSCVFCL